MVDQMGRLFHQGPDEQGDDEKPTQQGRVTEWTRAGLLARPCRWSRGPLTGVGRGGSLLASLNLTGVFPGARFAYHEAGPLPTSRRTSCVRTSLAENSCRPWGWAP